MVRPLLDFATQKFKRLNRSADCASYSMQRRAPLSRSMR